MMCFYLHHRFVVVHVGVCFVLSQALRLGAPSTLSKASGIVSHSPALVPASELAGARAEYARTRLHLAEERVVSAKLNQVWAVWAGDWGVRQSYLTC